MLSFPISPRSGQSYVAPNGQIYVWDGVKWLGTAISGGGTGGTGGGGGDYSWSIAADDSTQREILAGETVKLIGAGNITTSSDVEGNITITGTGTGGASAASTYSWSIAADDSTQREILAGESVKFIGAGGITTASDAEGNITITGNTDYNNLINKPDLASTYQFSVAADDSTQRVISTDELIKFVGAGGITTASDTEGNITITGPDLSTYATQSYVNNSQATVLNELDSRITGLNLAGTYQFSVAADDSTQRVISTDELIKFIGAGGITTASDAEGNITITGSGATTSSLVNGSKTVSLGSNGTLTLPSQPNLLTNVSQIFTTKIYKDAKTPTPTPAEITAAYDYWLGEQEFYNAIRNEDAIGIAPTTRSWEGLPPWEAYPLIVGFTGPGLPPPGNLATAAQSATNAYLSWKELVSNLEIVNGNQTIIFENTGNLILPGTVSMNGKLSLGPTLGGIHANQSTGIISIGDYIDADTGYGLAPSTTIAIGGAANVFQISTYGPPAKTWTFGKDGNLQIPGNLQISGDIRSEREINIDINLSDSTLRRWSFGEDGFLTLAGPVTLPNGGELRPSTTAYDTALAAWESIRGGEIQFYIDNGSVTPQGWPMYTWHPTGPTAQGYIDFLLSAWTVQQTGGTLIITPAISSAFYQQMRAVLILIRDTYNLNAQGISISSGYAKSWNFSETGDLTIPGGIRSDTGLYIDVNLSDSTLRRWQFGEDGDLTFPSGTLSIGNNMFDTITSTDILSLQGNGIVLSGGLDNGSFPTLSQINLLADGNVVVRSDGKEWYFTPNGDLQIPGNFKSEGNINIDINLSDSTLRRWSFGEDGELTVPGPINGLGNSKLDFTTYGANTAYLTTTSDDTTALIMFATTAELYAHTNVSIRTNTDGTAKVWTFGDDGSLTFPDATVQTTAWTGSVAYANVTGTPTLFSGSYNDLTNKPDLASTYQFSVAADDSTQRVISTDEVIKFIGAGGITTSSDAEGNITITGGSSLPSQTGNSGKYLTTDGSVLSWATVAGGGGGSELVNGAFTASLAATGDLTVPGNIRSEREINVEINLSDSTLRRWRFGEDGNLTIPGSITTTATTLGLVNATATTINFAGASTTLNIATALTGASSQTVSIATGSNTGTKTINIGTGGTTTNLQLGTAGSGVTTINSSTVVGSASTQTLYNSVATTLNFAGAATALNIGSTTGTITLNGPTVVGSQTTQNLYNTVATTVNEFGAATTINVATNAASGTTWTLGNSANTNTLTVAGGTSSGTDSITSTVTTGVINLFTGLTTGTLNIATGGASAVVIGGTGSTVTVGNGLTVVGAFNSTATAGVTAVNFNTEQLTITGNRISTTVTNANLELECNGTGGVVINSALNVTGAISVAGKQAVNGPAFRAYVDTSQAITSGSQQKVIFGTETFDTNSNFASSRFTPGVEGYYQLNATVRIAGASTTSECMITLWKNGAEYARGTNASGAEQGVNFYSMQVSDLAYANGTSDYFEIYIQQTSTANKDTTLGANISYFSGVMVRGA
jgi:hypothetical protein